jgi:hypothetical protein
MHEKFQGLAELLTDDVQNKFIGSISFLPMPYRLPGVILTSLYVFINTNAFKLNSKLTTNELNAVKYLLN